MKSSSVLTKTILLIIVIIFINACDKDEESISFDIQGDWKVISFFDNEVHKIIVKTESNSYSQYNNGDITVTFDTITNRIEGINVTNLFFGYFNANNHGVITTNNLIWTMIYEPEWGSLFHSIEEAETYKVIGENLYIYCNKKKMIINLRRISTKAK